MSSHLSVISTSGTGNAAVKAFGQPQGANDDTGQNLLGLFAALLNSGGSETTVPGTTETSQTSQSNVDVNLAGLIGLSLDAGGDSEPTEPDDGSDVVAAIIDAVMPIQDQVAAKAALANLLDGLADLRATLQAGQQPDEAQLDALSKSLDQLAKAFGVNPDDVPNLDQMAALANQILPEGAPILSQVTKALAPLVQTLADQGIAKVTGPDLANKFNAVADKLAALVKAMSSANATPDKLAALGLAADTTTLDPALDAAIAKLVAAAPVVGAATAPALANPTLKLSQSAITGGTDAETVDTTVADTEPVGTTKPSAPTTGTATSGSGALDQNASDSGTDDKRSNPQGIAAAVSGQTEAVTTGDSATAPTPTSVQATTRVDAPQPTRATPAVYQTNHQQLNVPQIAFELVRQVQHGNSKFQIRLDPPELGRIDVRLDIDGNGTVNARLMVEKSETLDLMQRDQRALQQALQQAGLDSSKTNLEFSLRQNNSGQQQQQQRADSFPAFSGPPVEELSAPTINLYRGSLSASGINIIA